MRILKQIKWILIVGGSIFFFFRAIFLASIGGDCFGTINPVLSWILLFSEIVNSGTTWVLGLFSYIKWLKSKEIWLTKIILPLGILTYTIHFIRVTIWLYFCVF